MVYTHRKLNGSDESLHLAVNYMDRFYSKARLSHGDHQLVAGACLLIAMKFEDIYAPDCRDLSILSEKAFGVDEVIEIESVICRVLDFELAVPTGLPFARRFLSLVDATETMRFAAKYYLEMTLMEHDSLGYRPSLLAAGAVCLAINNPAVRKKDGVYYILDKPGVVSMRQSTTSLSSCPLSFSRPV